MPRGCVIIIRLWPPRRDDHSGVLIGAGGPMRFDWPAGMLANDVSLRIDRVQRQWAASYMLRWYVNSIFQEDHIDT